MSLSFDLPLFFENTKAMIDIVRANQVGNYIDIVVGVLTALLALIFLWQFTSGSGSSVKE